LKNKNKKQMRTKMCSQKQDEEKKNPLLSNTNALNQARPTLQAMVFTGVFE